MAPSRMFADWLASTGSSLAFTTYQAGKVFLIGTNKEEGRLSVFERSFPRSMGFGVDGTDGSRALWLSSLYQLWRFENFLDPGQTQDGYDAVYVPIEGRTTGDIDIHDIHTRQDQQPVFVVTRFNCLATLEPNTSFKPIWKPPFIDRIAAEDRCHLNGLAMRDGKPGFVTCVSDTNTAGGWRNKRRDGGRESGKFEPMCFLPGFARGVSFFGNHAIIGVSRPRKEKTFEGLELQERLTDREMEATCMIAVVNLETGDIEHSIVIDGVVQELYDVAVLQGVARPRIIGFKKPEIRFMVKPAPLASL